jgi:hypothetical protein
VGRLLAPDGKVIADVESLRSCACDATDPKRSKPVHLPAQLQVERLQRLQACEANEARVRDGLVALKAQLP